MVFDAIREIGHIQRAGGHIKKANANHKECGAYRAHDQIIIRGRQGPLITMRTLRDQHIGRERRDFQKYEHIEGIARNRNAQKPREAKQKQRVKQRLRAFGQFPRHAGFGIGQHQGADPRDQQQHECIGRVDAVFYAQRGRPATQLIRNNRAINHLA